MGLVLVICLFYGWLAGCLLRLHRVVRVLFWASLLCWDVYLIAGLFYASLFSRCACTHYDFILCIVVIITLRYYRFVWVCCVWCGGLFVGMRGLVGCLFTDYKFGVG